MEKDTAGKDENRKKRIDHKTLKKLRATDAVDNQQRKRFKGASNKCLQMK